jgi:RNA polymerase sigma factor (sigma-70 family)
MDQDQINTRPSLTPEQIADQFEKDRSRLRAVAYRMLGSTSDAEDAVQETWLRLSRSANEVDNLGGWLTTVVSRVCLDMLRARKTRQEDPVIEEASGVDPEQEMLLADSVGSALLIVLETLTPAERLAFVLHDMFAVSFDEIGPIVGRSPAASRQLASRARRRLQGTTEAKGDLATRQRIVDAFLAASRGGDFDALLRALDPDAIMRSDATAAQMGSPEAVIGGRELAEFFNGAARAARPVLIDGVPGAAWSQGGTPRVVFEFRIADERIVGIDLIADPDVLAMLELVPVGSSRSRTRTNADRNDFEAGQDEQSD